MKLRTRIISGFGLVLFIGVILGINGELASRKIAELSNDLYAMHETKTSVSNVLNAHYIWRQSLTETVLTGDKFTGSLDPNGCALGQWKNSDAAKSITDSEILSLLSQLDAPHTYIHTEASTVVELIENGDLEGAKNYFLADLLPETKETINILTQMENRCEEMLLATEIEIRNTRTAIMTVITTLIIISLTLGMFIAFTVIRSILKPIRSLTSSADSLAKGELDIQTEYSVDDEIGQLTTSFRHIVDATVKQEAILKSLSEGDLTVDVPLRSDNDVMSIAIQKTIDNLNSMFAQINDASIQVSEGSAQISNGAQSLAQGTTEQAASTQELSSSISEVSVQTRDNANMAMHASELAHTIRDNAQRGSEQMSRMTKAVTEINEASHSIGKIIKVIDDIAFQTNILALNAAVEAARAGQHGKGFAVVAEEVRNLAAKSAEAAKSTSEIIESSIKKAEAGVSIADETAASLYQIVEGINESDKIINDIARSSGQQEAAISEINTGVTQVAQVIQTNSAAAQQSAAASEEMKGQSDVLQDLISRFKLKDNL